MYEDLNVKLLNDLPLEAVKMSLGDDARERMISVVSDTHDDFTSLVGSLLEASICSVNCNNSVCLLLDENYEYHFVEDKNDTEKLKSKVITNIEIPTPILPEKLPLDFYHLGDVIDRGKPSESLKCLTFLLYLCDKYIEKFGCNPIHLAIGNHETILVDDMESTTRSPERYLIFRILNIMFRKRYLSTGYIVNFQDGPVALWHASLNSNCIINIKDALEDIITERPNIVDNPQKFLNLSGEDLNEDDFSIVDKIKKGTYNFTAIELAKLKIAIGDMYFGNFLDNEIFKKLFIDVNRGMEANLLFWDDPDAGKKPVINQVIGHRPEYHAIQRYTYNRNTTFDVDILRSCHIKIEKPVAIPAITTICTVFFDKTRKFKESLHRCTGGVGLIKNVYAEHRKKKCCLKRSPSTINLQYKGGRDTKQQDDPKQELQCLNGANSEFSFPSMITSWID